MATQPPDFEPKIPAGLASFVLARIREEYAHYIGPTPRLDPHAFQGITFEFGPEGVIVRDIDDRDVTEKFLESIPKGPRDEVRVRDAVMKRKLLEHAAWNDDALTMKYLAYIWKDHPDYRNEWKPR